MSLLTAAVLFAQAQEVQLDPAEEGRKVIIGMLIVGLTFIAVIALGQLADWAADRRAARRPRPY
jgi:predicted membrane protein